MRYIRGTRVSSELVEFDIKKAGKYITTCVVNVNLLLYGVKAFPCGSGDDVMLTPEQRLEILEFVRCERKKITDSYEVKTYKGWCDSGLPTFEEYSFVGDTVDSEMVEHFVNSVPPMLMRSGCTQGGEAFSHECDEHGKFRPTYVTFHSLGNGRWMFDGYCFYEQNVNRYTRKSRLDERIDEARREA